MAWTGSAPNQTYQRTDGVRTGAAVNVAARNALVNDTAELADARENDLADGINLLWLRNGGNQPTANLSMNTFKFTGLGAGSARTDSIRLGQMQDGAFTYAEAGGTANAIELTTTPTCTPVTGMVLGFFAEADNTSTTTVALNGGSTLALQVGGAACAGGEVNDGQFHQIAYDGTQWQLVNPHAPGNFQPIDADLTAIAALTTTAYGRSLLTLADDDALAAEISEFYQPLDSDLTTLAGLAKTDGGFIVGDGAAWTVETGATARASLGLGTGDSPQFTAVNIGNASDTTITRTSAGVIAVEGSTVPTLGVANEWTAQQNFDCQSLTDGTNIAWDLNTQQSAKVTLAGNRTLSAPSNMKDGGWYSLRIIQDGTGGRTLSFNSAYKFEFGVAPTIPSGANDVSVLVCESDGSVMRCRLAEDFS